jgi:hypothetical protein
MNNSYYGWWNRINALIYKGIVLLLAALILTQVFLMNQTVKTVISRTDRLEGKSIADSQLFIKKGEIEITIEDYTALKALDFYVNGVSVPVHSGKSVILQVKDGDVIEVSGAEFNDMAILKVTSVSENVTVPELGKLIYVNNNLVLVDRVRLK